jgi:hypothetical protein
MTKASSDAKKASGGGWAAFVGALLGSGVLAALVALIPQYFPASPRFEWVKAGLPASDCTATDTAATYSSAKPQPENCASADEDTIAVCWDGNDYKNAANPTHNPSSPWCTYKFVRPDHCKDGVNPGVIWTCRAVQKR